MMTHAISLLARLRDYVRLEAPAPAAPVTVLIVDDEELVRRYVDRVLTEAGYRTALAADAAEAIEVAATLPSLDVLLSDLMMPNVRGDELARRMRRDDPNLKVLYFTGYSDRLFAERMILWENEAFLEKPCTPKALLQAVGLIDSGHIDGGRRRRWPIPPDDTARDTSDGQAETPVFQTIGAGAGVTA